MRESRRTNRPVNSSRLSTIGSNSLITSQAHFSSSLFGPKPWRNSKRREMDVNTNERFTVEFAEGGTRITRLADNVGTTPAETKPRVPSPGNVPAVVELGMEALPTLSR